MRYGILAALALLVGFVLTSSALAQGRSGDVDAKRQGSKVIVRDDSRPGRGESDDDQVGRRNGNTRTAEARRNESRGDDGWEDDDRDDDGDRYDNERRRKEKKNKQGKGPKFCRSGEGHPVHGRQWCIDKGFGLGNGNRSIWESRRSDSVLLPLPTRRNNGGIAGGRLGDILGDVVLGRLNVQARRLNAGGPLVGRMTGPSELRVFAGRTPVARFVDLNGDRRADVVYFRR